MVRTMDSRGVRAEDGPHENGAGASYVCPVAPARSVSSRVWPPQILGCAPFVDRLAQFPAYVSVSRSRYSALAQSSCFFSPGARVAAQTSADRTGDWRLVTGRQNLIDRPCASTSTSAFPRCPVGCRFPILLLRRRTSQARRIRGTRFLTYPFAARSAGFCGILGLDRGPRRSLGPAIFRCQHQSDEPFSILSCPTLDEMGRYESQVKGPCAPAARELGGGLR